MHKYTAKNLTNRTLQMHLPGGRYMRLSPGCTCSLKESDCKLPMVKKMMRKNALNIPQLGRSVAVKDQPEKPQEIIDKIQTAAAAQQSTKDQPAEADLKVAAAVEAGSEDVTDSQAAAAITVAIDQTAEQEIEEAGSEDVADLQAESTPTAAMDQVQDAVEKTDSNQTIGAGKKKSSAKKAVSPKKRQ